MSGILYIISTQVVLLTFPTSSTEHF